MMPLPQPVLKPIHPREAVTGFTLIEVLVVIAIIGIAMAAAMPGLRTLMDNQKMKSATFDLVTTVMQARSEAIKFGATTGAAISIAPASGSYTNASKFTNGWCIVFTSTSACDVSAPAGDVMYINAAIPNVIYTVHTCTTTSTSACTITFSRSGRLASGLSVKIEVSNDITSAPMSRCVTIDGSGNAMTKVGTCT